VLAVAVVLVVRAVFFAEEPAPQVRTVEAQRGTVRTAVTGTGTVEPVNQLNLSFGQPGQLTEVNVKVGDRVKAGQVLAKIDLDSFRSALQEAVGGLQQAQATLNNAREQNTVQTAQHELAAARQALSDIKNQVRKTIKAGRDLISSDRRQLAFDRYTLDRDLDRLERDKERLDRDRSKLREAKRRFRAHRCDNQVSPTLVQCMADREAVQQAQSEVDASKAKVDEDKDRVRESWARVLATEAKLSADERQLAIDWANGRKAIHDAQAAIVAARDALEYERINRPNLIAEQRGGVISAKAQVDLARQNLDDTTLVAQFDGTVAAVNARVGEFVAASGETTPLAPGSNAPEPITATEAKPGTQAGATGGVSVSPFIVLTDVHAFQVVVPFAEPDAARAQPGQKADVTFDALPGVRLPATVVAVAPEPTVIQNVTNYFVTLNLDQLDPRLRAGLTANAEIVVAEVRDALVVPNAAIQRTGEQTFVTVLLDDGTQRRVPVQTGLVGDTTTQVSGDLKPGDRVVLPTVGAPGGQPPPAEPGGG
jgi:HlyD family secretion protein